MFGFQSLLLAYGAAGKVVFSSSCLTFLREEGAGWRCPGTRARTICCQMGSLLPRSARGAAPRKHLPASADLYLLETEKMEKLRGLGAHFGARGKEEPPAQLPEPVLPAPHKPPLCAASRRTQSPLHLGACPGGKGMLCLPRSQGAAIQRGPVMLSSRKEGWQQRSQCPGRGATGRERSHAASQCCEVGQLHTDPLCPHRLGLGTSAGTPGRLWQR